MPELCELELLFYKEESRKFLAAYAEAQTRLRLTMTCRTMSETAGGSMEVRVVQLARYGAECHLPGPLLQK